MGAGTLSEDHLAQFFSLCGLIVNVRINGQQGNSPRFGWGEFASVEVSCSIHCARSFLARLAHAFLTLIASLQSAQSALTYEQQVLGQGPLRVTGSKSSIHTSGWRPSQELLNYFLEQQRQSGAYMWTLSSYHRRS